MFMPGERVKIAAGDYAEQVGIIVDFERDGELKFYTINLPNGDLTLKSSFELEPVR